MPLLGWSTVAGDYRVAHFVGMHALQVLPLVALVLAAAGRRLLWLADQTTQVRIVVIVAVAWAAGTVLLTVQAAVGQSVVHPNGVVATAAWALVLLAAAASVTVLLRARTAPVARLR
ncbi:MULTISPECIES: hypothetical protein [unclassified Curtobacterium]|uniref:hypothetical protein n=1 Tax=unclassified Curtobacterium TaxID=257496 RepID=UPI001E405CAB|nr:MULTISPECIES: hypothetical protein [unclassified Curtobacterium]